MTYWTAFLCGVPCWILFYALASSTDEDPYSGLKVSGVFWITFAIAQSLLRWTAHKQRVNWVPYQPARAEPPAVGLNAESIVDQQLRLLGIDVAIEQTETAEAAQAVFRIQQALDD